MSERETDVVAIASQLAGVGRRGRGMAVAHHPHITSWQNRERECIQAEILATSEVDTTVAQPVFPIQHRHITQDSRQGRGGLAEASRGTGQPSALSS